MRRIFGVLCLAVMLLPAAGQAADETAPAERTGLVLSGGGARGFAHIGALKALEELGVKVDVLTATSMGALVGGGYAAGYTADELREISLGVDWGKMFAGRADRSKLTWRRKQDDMKGLGDAEVGVTSEGISATSGMVPSHELEIFLARVTRPVSNVRKLSQLPIPYASMATDLVNGQRVVLSDNVALAKAMRASMSVPGVFAPVPYGDTLLVDGGLTDNLPVGEARKMGATRLIAINVGTPLSGRESLGSVVGVMGQMVNILTEQNVQASIASLGEKDILITPNLKAYSSGDFPKAKEIMQAGYDAVMAVRDKLAPYCVSKSEYAVWQAKVAKGLQQSPTHQIAAIRVDGLKTVNPDRVVRDAGLDIEKPVTDEDVAESARRIWAGGDFLGVPMHFEPGPRNTEVLVVEPEEKSWGYSALRFGGNVQFDTDRTQTFNVILAHTWGWLNSWGAEWRNEVQFGETRRFLSQWYQPLGASSSWYVQPSIEIERTPVDVYDEKPSEKHPYGRYTSDMQTAKLMLGYEFGRAGVAEVGGGYLRYKSRGDIGVNLDSSSLHAPFAGASVAFDTLDNTNFPRSGYSFSASVMRLFDESTRGFGDENISDHVWQADFDLPVAFDKNWSALFSARYGESSIPGNFQLGGAFNLSGSPEGRFTGDRMALGRVMLMRRVLPSLADAGFKTYVGATYEAGRVYNHSDRLSNHDKKWFQSNAIFVGADTIVGPVYVMAGRTYGVGNSLMFYWGRLN